MSNLDTGIVPEMTVLQRHKGWLMCIGIILFVLGCIGLSMEFLLTVVSMYFFAALLIVSGVSHLADAFKYKRVKGALWQVLIAIFYIAAGIIVLKDPLLASAVLTALLAWLLIFIGGSRIGMAFYLKGTNGWGWILFAGIASLILGILILLQWPVSALWVIGMFIAIDLIISGWTYILLALSIKPTA